MSNAPGAFAGDAVPQIQLGLGPNLAQFSLLVVVNAFVGAMVGLERTILPAIAEQEFHLAARTAVLSFIVVFGVVKAITNYFAGRLSDSVGRKTVLVGGWFVAVPVPLRLMWAPCCSGPARRWSILRCSPLLAMWPTQSGALPPWAFTAYGGISATQSVL